MTELLKAQFLKPTILSLVALLLLSMVMPTLVQASSTEINLEEDLAVQEFEIVDKEVGIINMKIIEEDTKIISESYVDEEMIGKSILYKKDGKIEESDREGNINISYIEDYIENIEGIEEIENIRSVSDDNMIDIGNAAMAAKSYTVPAGYKKVSSEYSSAWKATGNLYQKKGAATYGKEYIFNFSKGTKITTIYAVLAGLAKTHVLAALSAFGISVVASVIDGIARGKFKTRYIRTDSVVVVKNRLGLKSYKTVVDSYIYNERNGKLTIQRQRIEGDTRSNSNLIQTGIYNVVGLGM